MKFQWTLLVSFLFALIVAVFAVINVDAVAVNYLFGTSEWPLILVILASVLMGGLIVGSVGIVKVFNLQRRIKQLSKENENLLAQLPKQHETENVDEDISTTKELI
ncbi:LapA family protein [Bacillus sp. 2205SS5-2]|uniref:LapA family protein n=1 Tax=Bacillus sp. 2205SS5-2 TaxID=3109031 RepID=UPI003007B104